MNVSAIVFEPVQAQRRLDALLRDLKGELLQGRRHIVTIKPETRSSAQNSLMWTLLGKLSDQVIWHEQKLTSAEWKTMATASLKRQRVLPGIGGGFVVMGDSTSAMTIAEMTELIEFLYAFGAQHNVDFGEVLAAEPA